MQSTTGNTTQLQGLLDLAADGKSEAYSELICHASERLLRLTRKMFANYPHLRRWEQSDDVFQSAVLRLHRSLADVKPDSVAGFFGLASTQIRRTLIDLARHHFGPEGQAAKHHSNGAGKAADDSGGALRNQSDRTVKPESLQQWADFHEAVDLLPPAEREVFQLVWYGGLPQKEIATLLQISIPTVQRRLYRARHLIHGTMQGEVPPVQEGH